MESDPKTPPARKHAPGIREHMMNGANVLAILVLTVMAIGSQKPGLLAAVLPQLPVWSLSFSGDAAPVAIVALIGVILISRRHGTP